MISAVALGAGQVVSERSAKTLDYLLGRPVAGRQVVLAKFIAGSTVLLTLVGLLLALVFLGGKATDNLVGGGQAVWVRPLARVPVSDVLVPVLMHSVCFRPLWNSARKRSRVDWLACWASSWSLDRALCGRSWHWTSGFRSPSGGPNMARVGPGDLSLDCGRGSLERPGHSGGRFGGIRSGATLGNPPQLASDRAVVHRDRGGPNFVGAPAVEVQPTGVYSCVQTRYQRWSATVSRSKLPGDQW